MYIYRGKLNWVSSAENDPSAVKEKFTLIFPGIIGLDQPVYAYWQWTNAADGRTKVNNTPVPWISGILATPSGVEYTFAPGGGYVFKFVFPSDAAGDAAPSKLQVQISQPLEDRTTSVDLNCSYDGMPSSSLLHFYTTPWIYVGKLNWYSEAVDEMFILVAPDGLGLHKVYTYWQWTVTSTKSQMVNVDIIGTITKSVERDYGYDIEWAKSTQDWYSFRGDVDEMNDVIHMTMMHEQASQQAKLSLQVFEAPSSGDDRQVTSTVVNDTPNHVFCQLSEHSCSKTPALLAGLGLLPFGFNATDFFHGLPELGNVGSFLMGPDPSAFFGVVDVFAKNKPVCRQLCPHEKVSRRTTSLTPASTDNDLVLYTIYHDQEKNTYNIEYGIKENLGSGTWNVSELIGSLQFTRIFSIPFPKDHELFLTVRANIVNGLRPSPKDTWTFWGWDTDIFVHAGSWLWPERVEKLDRVIEEEPLNTKNYSKGDNVFVWTVAANSEKPFSKPCFMDYGGSNLNEDGSVKDNGEICFLSDYYSTAGTNIQYRLLVLTNCTVKEGPTKRSEWRHNMGSYPRSAVYKRIQRDTEYRLYAWKDRGEERELLQGYKDEYFEGGEVAIVYSTNSADRLFIPIWSWSPLMIIQRRIKEGEPNLEHVRRLTEGEPIPERLPNSGH